MYLMHNQNILGEKVITELAGKQQIFVQLYRACPIKPSTGKNSLNEVHLHLMLIIQKCIIMTTMILKKLNRSSYQVFFYQYH